jgi:hypothetical protein
MYGIRPRVKLVFLLLTLVVVSAILEAQVLQQLKHDVGQTVAPVFEGWEPNPDGTFSLYFGYMNRNYKETLDIPIGPNNKIEPGGPDRGQPTHFLIRRQKNTFRVVVPKTFGNQTLVWTLSIRGRTETVPGSIRPQYQINTLKDSLTGNTPPVVKPVPDQTTDSLSTKLTVDVSDDGLPKRREKPSVVTVEWSKYRGVGDVTFVPSSQPVADGQAITTATFSVPGAYVIRAVANDGSSGGTACCWTNAQLAVTVKSGSGSRGEP